jgi:hypothetical protein
MTDEEFIDAVNRRPPPAASFTLYVRPCTPLGEIRSLDALAAITLCTDCPTPEACRMPRPFPYSQEETPTVPTPALTLTEDSAARKDTPMARGVLDYFPAALAYVAQVSAYGNAKHNPDSEDLVWTRSKSYDHADCILRHLADRGLSDDAGIRHSGYVAWRALALLQTELEAEGAAPGRASVFDPAPEPDRVDCGGGVLTADMKTAHPGAEFFNYSRDCTADPCQPGCCGPDAGYVMDHPHDTAAHPPGTCCGAVTLGGDRDYESSGWVGPGCVKSPCILSGSGCPGLVAR